MPALLFLGTVYTDLPWWGAVLLLLAGLTPWLTNLPSLQTWSPSKRLVLLVLSMVIIASPALIWGIITTLRALAEPDYGY
jgi:hypothetical protein